MTTFLSDIVLAGANDIQFKNTSGANTGKIESDGNNLVLSNAVGDILLGDGASDVYIGDGTNNVDILFEQSGSIKAEDGSSGVTLTLGSGDTTLALGSSISSAATVLGALTVGVDDTGHDVKFFGATSGAYMLWDESEDGLVITHPAGDAGLEVYTVSATPATTPQFKVGRSSTEYFGVCTEDRTTHLIHRQDETDSGAMYTSSELWGSGSGNDSWTWKHGTNTGGSLATVMTLDKAGQLTITGEIEGGSLDINGNADISGDLTGVDTLTATTLSVTNYGLASADIPNNGADTTGTAAAATTVRVTDNESTNENNLITFVAGAADSSNNHGLEMDGNLTYNPSTGNITATRLTGTLNGNVTGNVTGDVTGNADTATTLATARTIGGVSFNGSANITLPGVNAEGNQNTTGQAATVATIAGLAPNTATTQATQGNITSCANLATVGTISSGEWRGTRIATAYQYQRQTFEFKGYATHDGTNYEIANIMTDTNAPFEHDESIGADGTTAIAVSKLIRAAGQLMPYAGTIKKWLGFAAGSGSGTTNIALFRYRPNPSSTSALSLVLIDDQALTMNGNNGVVQIDQSSFTDPDIAAGDIILTGIKGVSAKTTYFTSTLEIEWD